MIDRLISVDRELSGTVTMEELQKMVTRHMQEQIRQMQVELGLQTKNACKRYKSPDALMSSSRRGEVKTVLREYVHNYVWMEYGFRFMDPGARECWRKLVDKAIEDELTVKCPIFASQVYDYVEDIMRHQLRQKFSSTMEKYRRSLETLISTYMNACNYSIDLG